MRCDVGGSIWDVLEGWIWDVEGWIWDAERWIWDVEGWIIDEEGWMKEWWWNGKLMAECLTNYPENEYSANYLAIPFNFNLEFFSGTQLVKFLIFTFPFYSSTIYIPVSLSTVRSPHLPLIFNSRINTKTQTNKQTSKKKSQGLTYCTKMIMMINY